MERFERYDPEDLEHLMLERAFDELLPEEQAYALRHLQDAEEYERMRALLLLVQAEAKDEAPMNAAPATRERVLRTFREQRRPQWRIWLNSTGAFLFPPRPALYWRPALALGLLVMVSLFLFRGNEAPAKLQLAEVRPAPASSTSSNDEKGPEDARQARPAEEATGQGLSVPGRAVELVPEPKEESLPAPGPSGEASLMKEMAADVVQAENSATEPPEMLHDVATVPQGAAMTKRTAPAATQKMQAQGAVVESASVVQAAYTEDDLLGLLRAAW